MLTALANRAADSGSALGSRALGDPREATDLGAGLHEPEALHGGVPALEQAGSPRGAGEANVPLDERAQRLCARRNEALRIDELIVQALGQAPAGSKT